MNPTAILVHHTAGNETSPSQLRSVFHSRFGVSYIGYHKAISKTGDVWSDLREDQIGIHNNEGAYNNTNSLGIALVGNFEKEDPTPAQLDTLTRLLDELTTKYGIPKDKVFGHRDMKATSCPGGRLYDWLAKYKQGGTVDVFEERMHARADALRFAYLSWRNADSGEDMASIYQEARMVEEGKLNQKDLIWAWRNQAIHEGIWVDGKKYREMQAAVDVLSSELDRVNKDYKELGKEAVSLSEENEKLTEKAKTLQTQLTAAKEQGIAMMSGVELILAGIRKLF